MAQNMYRVGDYVYFEVSSSAPYQIRKIEELNKAPTGNVEAKVVCFYRRRDISTALLKIADQAERKFDEYYDSSKPLPEGYDRETGHKIASNGSVKGENGEKVKDEKEDGAKEAMREWGLAGLPAGSDRLGDERRHLMRQRELYVSRHMETLPATHIRGRCFVTLLSEVETVESYDREDAFFYSLMYNPTEMTLLADKGAIRVGDKYQAEVPDGLEEVKKEEDDDKENGDLMIDEGEGVEGGERGEEGKKEKERAVYHPHHSLNDRDIDQFLLIARAVGTFSRALDTSSSMRLPSLHMTAAAASRDVTLFHAMALLHQANYDIGQAVRYLVPPPNKEYYPLEADVATSHHTTTLGGPVLCRDQMEEWSAAEANLFEEAVDKYGKDFNDVRNDFLPWKSMRDIVEYYYMWKTTNRYVDQKKQKSTEQENKLKQVYIPNYNKPNPNLIGTLNTTGVPIKGTSPCEGCKVLESLNWYSWGPASLQLILCSDCWIHWKKHGGLKNRSEHEFYDLDGASKESTDSTGQTPQKIVATNVNSLSINKNKPTAALGGTRGGSQVVARLPPGHPQSAVVSSKAARTPFIMRAEMVARLARRIAARAGGPLNLRKAARRPFDEIKQQAIRTFCNNVDSTEVVKCAMQAFKSQPLPPTFVQALTTGTAFSSAKRPHSNGTPAGAPPAKKPAMGVA